MYETELAGASAFKESNSPAKVSPLVLDGVYFWNNSQKILLQPRKKPLARSKDQPGTTKQHLQLAGCQHGAPRKLVVELASLRPLSWPEFLAPSLGQTSVTFKSLAQIPLLAPSRLIASKVSEPGWHLPRLLAASGNQLPELLKARKVSAKLVWLAGLCCAWKGTAKP